MRRQHHGLTGCLALLLGAAPVVAQTTGAIQGTVLDPARLPVPNVTVRIVAAATDAERLVPTDGEGRYSAPGLTPGAYGLEVSYMGFQTQARQDVEVAAGRAVRVDFVLEVDQPRQRVSVVAESPLLSVSAADWNDSMEEAKLESLPLNGRDLYDLAAQEPGATVATTATKTVSNGTGIPVSVNGSRPNQNSFRLDGIYINDATSSAPTSAAGRLLGLEGIQELHLVSSPFSAEYGRAAGAVVTAVSRSGGNDLHGSLYGFFRNSALDAKNYFDAADKEIPELKRNQFGGMLSGPLRRGKVFLLVNYEAIREASSQSLSTVTLTEAAREGHLPEREVPVAQTVRPYLEFYPLPNGRDFGGGTAEFLTTITTDTREDFASGKVDLLPGPKLRFSTRYTFDSSDSWLPDTFDLWRLTNDSQYQFVHTETQYLRSANTIHTFRAGFSRVSNGETSSLLRDVPESLSFIEGQPLGVIRVSGLSDPGLVGPNTVRLRPRIHVTNDFQFSYEGTHLHGKHTFRFGGSYDRIQFNQRSDHVATGTYRFGSVIDLLEGRARSVQAMLPGSDSQRGWRLHQFSGFVQDELRLTPRFSATLGVRYETSSTPTEVNGKIASLRNPRIDPAPTVGGPLFVNPSRKNFAPRAALAWDLFGSGKTVIRAGAGIFHDLIGTRELILSGARVPPFFQRVELTSPLFPDVMANVGDPPPPTSPDVLAYNPEQPRVYQFQFAWQQQLGEDMIVQVGYAGSRGLHLPAVMGDLNPVRAETLPDGRLYFPPDAPRINPAFGRLLAHQFAFNSFYSGLVASARRRWNSGFVFQAKYTWGKSIDEVTNAISTDFANSGSMPMVYNYRENRGSSAFDLRHAFAANFSYALPDWGEATTRKILGGWEIHGLMQVQTGAHFSPEVGFDRANVSADADDLGQRPNLVAAPGAKLILGGVDRYFDPLAFGLPEAGFYGNLGRNVLTGPGLATVDLALHKILWKRESHSVRLRVEAFNVLNHPNFQIPSDRSLFNSRLQRVATAGRITSTTTTSRQIQIAARWEF